MYATHIALNAKISQKKTVPTQVSIFFLAPFSRAIFFPRAGSHLTTHGFGRDTLFIKYIQSVQKKGDLLLRFISQ